MKFNHELIDYFSTLFFDLSTSCDDHLSLVNNMLAEKKHPNISLSSLMNSRKRCGLKANRSYASRRTQRKLEKDLINEAKAKALKLGLVITPYKSVYQEGDSKGVIVYYKIDSFRPGFDQSSWDTKTIRALKGLALKQQLQSIGYHKPCIKSLLAGKDCLFRKFCKQFKPRLHFLKSEQTGDTYEVSYKVLEGAYSGYFGKRKWSDLLRSKNDSDDIRLLSAEQKYQWVSDKALSSCSGIRHVGQIINYVCPVGHKRSIHVNALVQWCKNNSDGKLMYPCDKCNRGVFSGINLTDSSKDRKAVVNFYITLSRIYNDHETVEYFGEDAPDFVGGLCVKVGFYYRDVSERSRGPYRVHDETGKYVLRNGSFFVRRIERGLAFIAETFFLRKYRNFLLDKELFALGRKVDGYSEMIGFSERNDALSAQIATCEVALKIMRKQYLNHENLLFDLSTDETRYINLIKKSESWRRRRIAELN